MKKIVIFTPCASKQCIVPEELKFHNLEKQPIDSLFQDWDNRKQTTKVDEVKVLNIYKGAYWNVVKNLYTKHQNIIDNVYIMGAGYGIVGMEDYIKPYSAAFSTWFEDDIQLKFNDDSTYKDWWNKYDGEKGLSISSMWNPNDIFIVSVNVSYQKAIVDDINKILHHDNVYYISPGESKPNPRKLPFSGLLQQQLGGSRRMINAITIEHLISKLIEFDYNREQIFEYFTDLVSKCKSIKPRVLFSKCSDDRLLELINERGRDISPYKLRRYIESNGCSASEPRILKLLNK